MLFYRHLLQYFFDRSYTLVLFPFDFTFNHYREAGFLIQEQYRILPELVRMATLENYHYSVYLEDSTYSWMGHSIGCKYIALLEGFNALPENKDERSQFIRDLLIHIPDESYSENAIRRVIADINALIEDISQEARMSQALICQYIRQYIKESDRVQQVDSMPMPVFENLFIRNQPSILLAPVNSGTSSAIRPKALADLVDKLGLGVRPTPAVTRALIQKGDFFNLLGLVCFQSDNIAAATCRWFLEELGKPPEEYQKSLSGGHLRPLGVPTGDRVFNFFLDKPPLMSISQRNALLESHINDLYESFKDRCKPEKLFI